MTREERAKEREKIKEAKSEYLINVTKEQLLLTIVSKDNIHQVKHFMHKSLRQ